MEHCCFSCVGASPKESRNPWPSSTLQRIQTEIKAGRVPGRELVHGVIIVAAGVLLLTPGLVTDVFGYLLFIPKVRDLVWRALSRRVVVTASEVVRVRFKLDGKKLKTLTKPNKGRTFVVTVNPNALKEGQHRVTAVTEFKKQSGTKDRIQRVTFSRCAKGAVSPAFTG